MSEIAVRWDVSGLEKHLNDVERRQLPYAVSLALTSTVVGARAYVQEQMDRIFDRPTPYAKRGVLYEKATKTSLVARLYLSGERGVGGNLPAAAFLGPEVHGGLRSLKAFEKQIVERGLMPAGHVVVPAARTPLNRYGNMTQGFINRVMADLQINYRGAGATRARSAASLKRNKNYQKARFFVPAAKSGLYPGVYQRTPKGSKVFPVMLFVPEKPYPERFDLVGLVRQYADDHLAENFETAFAKALRTAR